MKRLARSMGHSECTTGAHRCELELIVGVPQPLCLCHPALLRELCPAVLLVLECRLFRWLHSADRQTFSPAYQPEARTRNAQMSAQQTSSLMTSFRNQFIPQGRVAK